MPVSSLLGGKALLICSPATSPSQEAQIRNGLNNQGIELPKPDRMSVEFGCRVVAEQATKPEIAQPQPAMPSPQLAAATP